MKLESEKRYYIGWGLAFIGLMLAIILQSAYNDLSLSTGVFLLSVGFALGIVAFIPKYEALTLGSGGAFAIAGIIVLLSRYAAGNFMYGLTAIVGILGVILLLIGKNKE